MKYRTFLSIAFCLFVSLSFGQSLTSNHTHNDELIELDINPQNIADRINNSRSGTVNLPFDKIGYSDFLLKPSDMLDRAFTMYRPDMKVYDVVSTQNNKVTGSILITENGFWSTIFTEKGLTSISPKNDSYVLEQGVHFDGHGKSQCGQTDIKDWVKEKGEQNKSQITLSNGTDLRRFRLAAVCTGEFYVLNGNNDADVEDEITAVVMGINVIFRKDLAVQFQLLTPFLYKNKNTDPFDPPSSGDNRPTEASQGVNMAFPNVSSYDVGHAFHKSEENDGWGSGGIAQLNAVCNDNISNGGAAKARGWSGSFNTSGNGFIALTAHEFAHMYGATHTFNGDGGFDGGTTCTDAHENISAYEIGSGTTIMSYNGLCDEDQNIQSSGELDNYFHVHSIAQMLEFLNSGGVCSNDLPLSNTPPNVTANSCGGVFTVPKNTPFYLQGSATDGENDLLTYCWEQYDEDGSSNPTRGKIGNAAATDNRAPLFRSFPPSEESIRYFPSLQTVAQGNSSSPFEVLSAVSRSMNFQLTVRDNNEEGGGIASDETQVTVSNNGPLSVQNINAITAGEEFSFAWSTNNTEDLCTKAKVLMSIDGGMTFPFTIASDVDYSSGSTMITLSSDFPGTEEGRLMLVCDDQECYSFFDVSNNNIQINSDCLAEATFICDTDYEVFEQGDPTLNLGLDIYNGSTVQDFDITITASNPLGTFVMFNETETGCEEKAFPNRAALNRFTVDNSGTYRFAVEDGISTIFDADNYDFDNPCNGAFIASNTTSTGELSFSQSSAYFVDLVACTEYVHYSIVNASQHPVSADITSITGPGNVVLINEDASPNYTNTFIAVNEFQIIEAVSPTSDFTSLSGGEYEIFGVSYKTGGVTPPANIDPSTWIGQNIGNIQTNSCMLLSENKKRILIEFSCRITGIEIGDQSACDPLTNHYSQDIIVTYEEPPLTGNLIVNGNPFPITSSPQTVTINGQLSDGQMTAVNASFSEISTCAFFLANAYAAPKNCCEIEFDLGEDRFVCNGDQVILDAGEDGVEYHWFVNGVESANISSTLEAVETGAYVVEVINDVGCSKFEDVTIVFNDSPIVELPEDFSLCEGEIFSLQSNTTATKVAWYKDDVKLDGETDLSLLITGPGQYVLVGSLQYEQPDMSPFTCSSSDTVNIDYVMKPIVDLGDDQQLCENETGYMLNAGLDGTIYTWTRNGVVLDGEESEVLSVSQSGDYIAIVNNGGSCATEDTVNIEFFPNVEVFAGQDINVCIGSTNMINSFINADSYEWFYEGNPFSDQSENPTVSEGGEYVLIGRNEIGCEVFDTVTVTSLAPPNIDLGEDRIGCIGSDVSLSIDSVGTIFWRKDGTLFSNNATVSITEPGEYIVSVIAASDCGDADTISVDFLPGPSLELEGQNMICEGDMTTLSATTDGTTIVWSRNGETIMGESDFMIDVSQDGVYKATVAGDSGCEVEEEITVTVNQNPTLDLGEDKVVCDGEPVELSTEEVSENYEWTFGGEVVSDQSEFSVTEAGVYTLEITNEFGCTTTDDVEVIANAIPTVMLEDSYAICEGEDATIVAEGDGDSFEWIVNGETLTGQTSNTISLSEDAMVEVIVSSSNGCTAMSATQVSSASAPTVDLGEDVSICPSGMEIFEAGDHAEYEWTDGTTMSSSSVSSIEPSDITTQIYGVTVTNEAGCKATDEINITFFPVVNGMVEASAAGVCNGEPVVLTASGGTNYQWIPDDGNSLDTLEGPSVIASPDQTTTYQVIVSDDCPANEDIASIEVGVFEANSDLSAGEDDCAINGNTLDLSASGGASYQWVDDVTIISGSDTANPTVLPTEETTYIVDITDANGCVFRDSVVICLLDDPLENFKLVSIITPNGDGENDALYFNGLEAFPENTLTIYNRWGHAVFEKTGYQSGEGELWNGENDGDVLTADTYYYVLTFNNETYKSSITLIR